MARRKTRKDLRKHFGMRLAQRYGIPISDQEYDAICAAIADGRHEPDMLFRESWTRTHYVIEIAGQRVRVVWHKPLKALATALPRESLPG